jgi:cysteine sulfinate desulfinase/cysteine desulfurase-like protein
MVATQRIHKDWKKLGVTYMQVSSKGVVSTLALKPLLKDEQRAKCGGVVDGP